MDNAKPAVPSSESEAQAELAPETHNAEQDDEGAQAQTLADERLGRREDFELPDSERVGSGGEGADAQDLVDHMNQMLTSGRIDNSAFLGERSDDDEDGQLGPQGIEDDFPRGEE